MEQDSRIRGRRRQAGKLLVFRGERAPETRVGKVRERQVGKCEPQSSGRRIWFGHGSWMHVSWRRAIDVKKEERNRTH